MKMHAAGRADWAKPDDIGFQSAKTAYETALRTKTAVVQVLTSANASSVADERLEDLCTELLRGSVRMTYVAPTQAPWYRARPCEGGKPFAKLSELIYREDGCRDYGRAQRHGSKMLYASWNEVTALDEIGAEVGDLVQFVAVVPQPNKKPVFAAIGDWQSYYASGRPAPRSDADLPEFRQRVMQMSVHDYLLNVYVDSVIASLFRAPSPSDHEKYKYKITATLAEILLQPGTNGLMYPSVCMPNSFNAAIPAELFDAEFEVYGTRVVRVMAVHGYSMYDLEHVTSGAVFEGPAGSITYEAQRPEGQPGWRKVAKAG